MAETVEMVAIHRPLGPGDVAKAFAVAKIAIFEALSGKITTAAEHVASLG